MRWADGKWYVDVARVIYLLLGVILGDQVRPLERFISDTPHMASVAQSVASSGRGTAAESGSSVPVQ